MSTVSDAGAFLDPEASREYLRSWKQDVEQKAERAASMAARIDQLRTTARDANNLTEVTVDSTGVLVDLVLTERTRNYDPQVVARAVLSTLREAQRMSAEQAREIAVEALGPDSTSVQVITERMQRLLSEEEPPDSDRGWAGRDGDGWEARRRG